LENIDLAGDAMPLLLTGVPKKKTTWRTFNFIVHNNPT
jgi:hypothetical protein